MPRTSAPVLPPELVGLIVAHLSGSTTLRFCALVSRTWATPCQRALFHDLHLDEYLEVVRLPAHLTHYPHLQRLLHHISVCQTPQNMIATRKAGASRRHEYLSGLISLFPLISHITSLDVIFDRSRPWDTHDQQFVEAFHTFLQQSDSSLKVLALRYLQEPDIQQMLSFLDGTQLQRLTLHVNPSEAIPVDFFSSTLSIARLPSLELLRIDTFDANELDLGFLRQDPRTMFPKLEHLEIVVYDGMSLTLWFEDALKPAALRLESFRLELTRDVDDEMPGYLLPTDDNLFDGLQCKHLQLLIFSPYNGPIDRGDAQAMIDWFAAMFRHLGSGSTMIHFTELTFTFPDELVEWGGVDEVLSQEAFGGVERIRFEEESRKGKIITSLEHPELVSAVRDAFPRLASRGVLCFE